VHGRVEASFVDLGEQDLKNIARPVRAYRVAIEGSAAADAQRKLQVATTIRDRPSMAVLPFQNMSGDPEQDYFADGISEDVITALSKLSQLFVIAREAARRESDARLEETMRRQSRDFALGWRR
jgi:adenylate cyclase